MTQDKFFTILRHGAGQSNYSLLDQEFKLAAKTVKYDADGNIAEIQEFVWNTYQLSAVQKIRGAKKQTAARMFRKVETNDHSQEAIYEDVVTTDQHGNEVVTKTVIGYQRNTKDKPIFQGMRGAANPVDAGKYSVSRRQAKAMAAQAEEPKHDEKLSKIDALQQQIAQLQALLKASK
jgi:hypothetical protein